MAAKKKKTRRAFPDGFKRKLVREASKPGVMLKDVGAKYDVNPNMITRWKKDPNLRASVSGIPTRPRRRAANGRAEVEMPVGNGGSRLDEMERRLSALEEQIYGRPGAP